MILVLPISQVATRMNLDLETGGLFTGWDNEKEATIFVPPAGSLLVNNSLTFIKSLLSCAFDTYLHPPIKEMFAIRFDV